MNQEFKAECLFTLMNVRHWQFCLLSDLDFSKNGVREYEYGGVKWVLVIRGKVGIALREGLAREWRAGGENVVVKGGQERKGTRCVAVTIPRARRRRGLTLVAAYAPCSGPKHARARERFYEELQFVEERSRGKDNLLVIGGEFNAEVGRRETPDDRDVIGAHGPPRLTGSGRELKEFCRDQFFVMITAFRQKMAATWWHVRYRTAHQLDHFLVRPRDWWV